MVKVLLFCSLLSGWAVADSNTYLMKLKAEKPLALQHYLEAEGYDVAGANAATGDVSVVTQFPFRIFVEQSDIAKDPELRFSVVSQERSEPYLTFSARENSADATTYFGVPETIEMLRKLEQKYPQWVHVFNVTEYLGVSKTEEGSDIYGIQVSLRPTQIEDEAKILVIGQHHARELTTQHAVLDSAEDFLVKAKMGDSASVKALQEKSIWFIPILNPDGLTHVLKENRMWRKNRSHNQDGTRGVDLNRNYDFKWGTCGANSADPNNETFKGHKPNSEPEILLMHALNEKLRFQYSISYHSYGNEILNPYLCGDLQEQEAYFRMRDLLASTLGFGTRPPSSSGEDHEYHYNKFGTMSFLIEIGEEFQPPFETYANEVRPTVKKVLPLLLDKGFENVRRIQVVDSSNGKPLQALLNVNEITFKEGETRLSDSFGTFYWDLPKKALNLTVTKDGYEPQNLALTAEESSIVVKLRRTRFGLNGLELLARFFSI